jgi:hypothetical protein
MEALLKETLGMYAKHLGREKTAEICKAYFAAAKPSVTPPLAAAAAAVSAAVSAVAAATAELVVEKKKPVIERVKKPASAAAKAAEPAPAPAPAPAAAPSTNEESKDDAASETSEKRKKKVVEPENRCDARVYGEEFIEIEGTKGPNGKPLHAFKPAQCDRAFSETFTDADGGKMKACKICAKHFNAKEEKPAEWHGFFDDGEIPEKSHLIGGPWHKKKLSTASK